MSFLSKLFRRAYPLSLDGFADMHSHILPGVDDGVETMEDALEILGLYEEMGIKEVWLTPHIMEDMPNSTDDLRKRYQELQAAYEGEIKLHLAAENMIDNLFLERLEANDFLPIGEHGNTLLVETSYFNAPVRFDQVLESIKKKGYFPLLAHPERYSYINTIKRYRELKDKGVRFQLNLMSLEGHYGPVVKEKAQKLLSLGLYDCCGSDLHRMEHAEIIDSIELSREVLDSVIRLICK